MRTRLRLGAATVVALGALLLATALASPAFAWDASIDVKAKCLANGDVGVKYTVTAWEGDHPADVSATYSVNGGAEVSRPGGTLDKDGVFEDKFTLPAGTTGKVVVKATVAWTDSDEEDEDLTGKAWLPKKCKDDTTTSSSIEDTTTSSSIEDTTTTEEETTTSEGEETTTTVEETTTSEVLGETSTTAGGQLPFTGASSGPMLLAGLGLVGGGLLFLWSSRARRGQASR